MLSVLTSCSSSETIKIGNLTVDRNAESLALVNSGVTSLSKVKKLTNLKKLDLSGTDISELKGIEKLAKLEKLIHDGSKVTEIDELTELPSLIESP